MRAHLEAVAAHLAPLGYPVHLGRADGATEGETAPVPYLVVRADWCAGELPVCGVSESLDTRLYVTYAASTYEGALTVAGRARDRLSLHGRVTRIPLAGRVVHALEPRQDLPTQADLDLRLPSTSRHPQYGVLSFRLVSEPA